MIIYSIFLIVLLFLILIIYKYSFIESFIDSIKNKKLLTDMEMKSFLIFKDFNQGTYHQFRLSIQKYNYLKTLHPYNTYELVYLNKRILEIFDEMTFHLPYRQLDQIASGLRYELKIKLESDYNHIIKNTSGNVMGNSISSNKLRFSKSSDISKQIAIPQLHSPMW